MRKVLIFTIVLIIVAAIILFCFNFKGNRYNLVVPVEPVPTMSTGAPPSEEDVADQLISLENEMRDIQNNEDLKIPILSANGVDISKADWEIEKVRSKSLPHDFNEKEALTGLILDKVLLVYEAERLNLTPTDEEIDEFVEKYTDYMRQSLELDSAEPNYFPIYLSKKGITKEDYLDELRENYEQTASASLKRSKLYEMVEKKYKEEIEKPAFDKGEDITITFKDYYNNYKQKLLDKAKIKVYDEDIKKLLKK